MKEKYNATNGSFSAYLAKKNYLRFILLLMLFLGVTNGYSQFENVDYRVIYNPQNLGLNVAGQSDDEITVQAKQGTLHDFKITFDLPDGVSYVPGTVTITDNNGGGGNYTIAEDNIANLNAPVFSILRPGDANWGFGDFVKFTFTREADCPAVTLRDNGGIFKDNATINYKNATVDYSATDADNSYGTYDLLAPSLSVETITPLNGVVGGTVHTRVVKDANGGNASLSEGEHIVDLGSSITNYTLSYNGTVLTPDPASTATHLIFKYTMGVAPFDVATADEDGNGVLDPGEKLDFTESFTITDCNDTDIDHKASWSCQTSQIASGSLLFGTGLPDIQINVLENHSNVCGVNHVVIEITNNAAGVDKWAKDVLLNLGLGSNDQLLNISYANNNRWAFDYHNTRHVSNFTVGGNPFSMDAWATGISGGSNATYAILPDTHNTDFDGAGGFSDVDGDGFFDDIAPGDTVHLEFDYEVTPRDDCGQGQFDYMYWEHVYFNALSKNQCGIEQDPKGKDLGYRNIIRDYANPTLLQQDTDIVEAVPFEVAIKPYYYSIFLHNDHAMLNGDADNEFVTTITVPTGVTLNGAPAGFTQTGNTITYTSSNLVSGYVYTPDFPDGFVRFPLIFDCAAFTAAYGQINNVDISYKTTIKLLDGGGNSCFERDIHCGNFQTIVQHSCNPPCSGPVTTAMNAHRITAGWTDSSMTTLVDLTTLSEEELEKYLAGDEMQIDVEGYMSSMSADNLHYKLRYTTDGNGGGANVIQFISAEIYFYDDSAGTNTAVYNLAIAPTVTSSGNNHVADLDLTDAVTNLMSGQLDDQDKFYLKLIYKFDETVGYNYNYHVLSNFRSSFYVLDNGGNEISCLDYGDNAGYLKIDKNLGYASNYTLSDCNEAEARVYNSMYSGTGDLHPNEYRPVTKFESIDIEIPQGLKVTDVASVNNMGTQTVAGGALTYTVTGTTLHIERGPNYIDEEQTSRYYPYFRIKMQGACTLPDGSNPFNVLESHWKKFHYGPDVDAVGGFDAGSVAYNAPDFIIQPLVSSTYTAYAPEADLDLQVVNQSSGDVDYNWIMVSNPNIQVTGAFDISGGIPGTALNVVTVGDTSWVEIGDLAGGTSKDIRIKATYSECSDQTITFSHGWDCNAYPTDYSNVDASCYQDTTDILLQPADAQVQQQITQQPAGAVTMCSPFQVNLEINSAQLGTLVDPSVVFTVNSGTAGIQINSIQMEYPAGSGNWETLPAASIVDNGTNYTFDVTHTGLVPYGGIPGVGAVGSNVNDRRVNVLLDLQTTCSFISNTALQFQTYANRTCGEPATGSGSKSFTDAIQVNGLQAPYDAFPTVLLPDPAAPNGPHIDGCSNATFTFQTHFSDIAGNPPANTGNDDYGKVTLPAGVTYVNGSFASTGANTVTLVSATANEIVIKYPAGLQDGDETEFTIDVTPDNGNCANDVPVKFINYVEKTPGATCGGGSCGTNLIATGDTQRDLDINKPFITVSAPATGTIGVVSNGNAYDVTLNLVNSGTADMPAGYTYDIYCNDGAGNPTGTSLYNSTLPNPIPVGGNDVLNITFNSNTNCGNGLVFVMNPDATNCLCGSSIIPIALTSLPIQAEDDAFTTNEETAVSGNLFLDNGNGDDVLGATPTTVTNNTNPAHGTVTVNTDGTFTYTPDTDFAGTDTFDYTITDNNGNTSTATVTITVNNVNDVPTATDNVYTGNEDNNVAGNVITDDTGAGVDSDPDVGDTLSVTQFAVGGTVYPAGTTANLTEGDLTVNSDGSFTFVPAANYNGAVPTATYTLSDGNGGTDTADLDITILPVNDPPVANDDSYTATEDTPLTLAPLTNDTDADGDSLTVTEINGTALTPGVPASITVPNGTVNVDAAGNITFVPDPDFNGGPITFPYTISDGNGGTDTANITINVTAVNDAPVATDNTYTGNEDNNVTGNVITDDTGDGVDNDVDGDPLSVTQFTVDGNTYAAGTTANIAGVGQLTVNSDGSFTFVPDADYNGTVPTAVYTLSDGNGGSDTANLNITILPVNDPPVANDDSYTATEDTPLTLAPLTNDTDADGDSLTVMDINGTVITPGVPASITVPNGTVNVDAAGNISFTPDPDFNGGPITFPYTISDGNGGTDTANITINVTAVNDAPVATDNVYNGTEDNNVTGNILTDDTGLGVDSDVDGDPLSVTQFVVNGTPYTVPAGGDNTATIPGVGALTIGSDGSMTFVPDANYNGTVPTVTYTVSDGNGGSDTADVIINIASVNDLPVANDDSTTTLVDTPVTFSATDNDTDIDGTIDPSTVDLDPTTPAIDNSYTDANGNVWTVDNNGDVTFTPASGFSGTATIPYTVNDNEGGTSNQANLSVFVENPELEVTKDDGMDLTVDQPLVVGSVINYTIVVSNTGNVDLTNIIISDPNADSQSDHDIDLAAGNTYTVTATHIVTQADIDRGYVENSARVTAFYNGTPVGADSDDTDPASPAGSDDPTVTNILQIPALTVTKDDMIPANATVGDDIVYTIVVTNTGNVTLNNIVVTDANALIGGNNTISVLAPGDSATFTATHTITQSEMNSGSITNTAVATGEDTQGNLVTDTSDDPSDPTDVDPDGDGNPDDPTVSDLTPYQVGELTATLDDNDPSGPGNPSTYNAGDPINYNLNVANTGNVSITPNLPAGFAEVIVTVGGTPYNAGDTNHNGLLDPGEVWQYTGGTHFVTQSEIDSGSYSNQVSVSGTDPNGATVTDTASDDPQTMADNDPTTTYFALVSQLEVKKQDALPVTVAVGQDITYTITVTNTGNTTLDNVSVQDTNAINQTYMSGDTNSNNVLDPGETWTYQATHTITQSDMDSGYVSNQASATAEDPSNNPVEDTASDDPDTPQPDDPTITDLTPYQSPQMETLKQVTGITDNGLTGDSAGDVIHYQISVENTGNVTISGLQITDDMITNSGSTVVYSSGDTDSDGQLDVGETWIYTADYTVTQSDIDNGSVSNTAVAYGLDSNGTPLNDVSDDPLNPGSPDTDHDPTVTNFIQTPELTTTKVDASLPVGTTVGDYITYTIEVTNTGNVTIDFVSIDDPNATMNGVGSTPLLAPGDSVTFTAVHQITQADMDAGFVDNQATANGTDTNGNPVTDISDDPDTAVPDDPTHTDLTPFQVVSMEVTLDDNVQTNPANPYNYNVGDVITYTAELTNTGNVSITPNTPAGYTAIEVGGFNVGDTDQDGELDPGEVWQYSTTHTITQGDIDAGQVVAQETFTGTAANGTNVSDVSDDPQDPTTLTDDPTVTYIGQFSELTVEKTGVFDDNITADGIAEVGETITYTITVTNTGNQTITDVQVTDPNAVVTPPANQVDLLPGESYAFTAVHTLTQADIDAMEVENQATASGTDPSNNTVTDLSDDPNTGIPDDPTLVSVPVHAEITIDKSGEFTDANGNGYADVGEVVTYTFTVHNAGDQTVSNVSIDDSFLTAAGAVYVSGDTNGNNKLDVGEDWTFTGEHILTQSDIDSGMVYNQALLQGEDPQGNTLTDLSDDPNDTTDADQEGDGEPDDVTSTVVPQHPELELFKYGHFNDENGNGLADIGETISYTFTVTNIGNVTLTDVTIDDPLPGIVISGTPIILLPGESDNTTFTAVYTLTKYDIDNGKVINSAVVTGMDPQGNAVTDLSDDGSDVGPNADSEGDGEGDDPTVVETLGLDIMTVFTPNGDGVNETWEVLGLQNFPNNTVKIYNRWGNLVYEKEYYTGDWDGTSNGRIVIDESGKLPVGTYYYIIDLGDGHKPFTGYLYLNR